MKPSNLSDQQQESRNALLTQALWPLDRPEALVPKVAKNFMTANQEEQNEANEMIQAAEEDWGEAVKQIGV